MTILVQTEARLMLNETERDEDVLSRFLNGEDEAFMLILKRYEVSLIRYLHHLVGHGEVAKDLCQDTFLKLIQKPPSGNSSGSLRAWLFRVAHNKAMDHLRKNRKVGDLPPDYEEQPDEDVDLQRQMTDGELSNRLRQLIGRLPDQMKEVLCLRVFGELRFREIAKVASMPIGTALWRMNKAVAHLRKNLEEEGWL